MTIKLTSDRYRLVAAGKKWALFWPRRAWAALPDDERLALVLHQHFLFDVDGPAARLPRQRREPLPPANALSRRDRQPAAPDDD